MTLLKSVFFLHCFFCCFQAFNAQTGSSFFYYYSPNQPMRLTSQSYGSNPQAYHETSSSPFNFLQPTAGQTSGEGNGASPSFGHFPAFQSQQQLRSGSLLDKIRFSNAPSISPNTDFQYDYQIGNSQVPPTAYPMTIPTTNPSAFSEQTQPSPKVFNFLNQPFQFFQNHFHRFQSTNEGQGQQVSSEPLPYHYQNDATTSTNHPSSRPTISTPTVPEPHNYYTQYFTTKTTKGRASYTFTIEANPTIGPTAMVQVNMGSDLLPATFPTLPPSLFLPRRNKTSEMEEIDMNDEPVATTTPSSTTTTSATSTEAALNVELQPPIYEPVSSPNTAVITTTTPTTTASPVQDATTPGSKTTTPTVNIALDQEDSRGERKPVKRVIVIRRKILRPITEGNGLKKDSVVENKDFSLPYPNANQIQEHSQSLVSTSESPNSQFKDSPEITSSNPTAYTGNAHNLPSEKSNDHTDIMAQTTRSSVQQQSTTEKFETPTTFRFENFNEPLTTTSAPVGTTSKVEAESTTEKATRKPIDIEGVNSDEYEYYYYDDENESSTPTSTTTTSTEGTKEEFVSTTPAAQSSDNSTTSGSTTVSHSDSSTSDEIGTTTPMDSLVMVEDEIIEPLSTTERSDRKKEIELTTQGSSNLATTTDMPDILTVTTFRPRRVEKDEKNFETTTTIPTDTENENEEQSTEYPSQMITGNTTSEHNTTENVSNDFSDEYTFSQEDYIPFDPLEDERILEAQRQALQNALKNIRRRLQNASTTEQPEEEDDQPKFIRKTNVLAFPSITSVSQSVSYSINEDEEELEDSRANILNKIQTFRTKLRKVVNREKATATRKPKRVTRPSLTTTSATSSTEYPKNVSDVGLPSSTESSTTTVPPTSTERGNVPITPKVLGSLIITEILPTVSTSTEALMKNEEIILDDFDTDDEQSTTTISTTISSSTETIWTTAFPTHASLIKSKPVPTTTTLAQTEKPLSSSMNPQPLTNSTISEEESIVGTSTSRTIKERKVKVILKRRKGAPKGTGTVARQVIRTRTRVKPRVESIPKS